MRVLLLTSITPRNIFLVNYLTERHNVVAKVIEKKPAPATIAEKMRVRWKMARRHGLAKTLNKLLYNKYRQHFLNGRDGAAVSELFGASRVGYSRDIPTLEVGNVNDEECIEFIKTYAPDVIAVCGTGIIKPEVFSLSRKGTINIHCGITPEYRSADPVFWALYNGEPEKVGVTIHFVDKGIDTGGIIYQQRVEVTGSDTIESLYCKCIKEGAELLSRAIADIEGSRVRTIRKEGSPNRAYFHVDLGIWQYMKFARRFEKMKKRLATGRPGKPV